MSNFFISIGVQYLFLVYILHVTILFPIFAFNITLIN